MNKKYIAPNIEVFVAQDTELMAGSTAPVFTIGDSNPNSVHTANSKGQFFFEDAYEEEETDINLAR